MDGVDRVAALVRDAVSATGSVLVAVDGVGASGKSTFVDALATRFGERPVVVLRVDDFFNAPPVRHARGRLSAEGFWLDAYDYDALEREALGPLKNGGEQYSAAAAHGPDAPLSEPRLVPTDALVLVDGTFLLRDRLRRWWDYSIYLDVPFTTATARMIARGTVADEHDPLLQRWFGAQQLYFEQAAPLARASLVIDNAARIPRVAAQGRASGQRRSGRGQAQ